VPASPTLMPDRATVCRCNGVTKGDLVQAWSDGATTVEAVASCTRATTGCGGCTDAVCGLLEWLAEVDPPTAQPATSQQLSGAGEHTVSGGKRQVTPAEMRAS
jgi:assimilatory nitrate reductase electron transfer subunit